jgi:acyl-coenzyme A thioesterase PaaI-like protein
LPTPQPNSRHCFVCGLANPFSLHLRFYDNAPGEVVAETTIGEPYQGYPGVVHGGIVSAMLDEAAGRALMVGTEPRFMYTARLEVRYRQNVPVGVPLRLVGKVGKSKARTATATSALYTQDGKLLAEAEALLVDIPDLEMTQAQLDELGWKVYPEDVQIID